MDTQVKTNTDTISTLQQDLSAAQDGLDGKAGKDLSDLTDAGKGNLRNIAKESVDVISTDNTVAVVRTDTETLRTFDLSVKKDGRVEEGNDGIVTGGTVYTALQNVKVSEENIRNAVGSELDKKLDKNLSNITDDGKNAIKDVMKPELDKKADVDASNINVDAWAEKLGTGEVAEGNNGLVNGGVVYNAIKAMDTTNGTITYNQEKGSINIGGTARYDDVDVVSIAKSDSSGRVLDGIVTDPSNPNSAANVGYVNAMGENFASSVNHALDKVGTRVNKVGAGAAALAALHPIDTDDKFTMGLGYGNYRNANAMALGMFYRPTEKIMLSVGGAMGNGENMINAGLSFALDKGKGFGTSKAAMARKINDLTAENAAQAAKIETLEARLAAIESKLEK